MYSPVCRLLVLEGLTKQSFDSYDISHGEVTETWNGCPLILNDQPRTSRRTHREEWRRRHTQADCSVVQLTDLYGIPLACAASMKGYLLPS